jgi:teichuronic acid biosynthesis glycosyltransferase TuaG
MPSADPLISVIVPVYNGAEYVAAAVESALAQTVRELEVVIVDDGSTDTTPAIAAELAARDSRVVVVRQANRGLAGARNTALRHARGSYVGFLDADDLWLPQKLERQVPYLRPGAIVYGDAQLVDDAGEALGRLSKHLDIEVADFDVLLSHNVIPVVTAVVDRTLLVDPFAEELRSAEDWHLWLRLAAAGHTFTYIPEPLAVYRIRAGALSSDPAWMARWRLAALELLEVEAERRNTLAARIGAERRLLVGELRRRAWAHALAGDVESSRDDLRAAARLEPRSARSAVSRIIAGSPPLLRAAARRLNRS